VSAKWLGDDEYYGKTYHNSQISRVNSDGTYYVTFPDGCFDPSLEEEYITADKKEVSLILSYLRCRLSIYCNNQLFYSINARQGRTSVPAASKSEGLSGLRKMTTHSKPSKRLMMMLTFPMSQKKKSEEGKLGGYLFIKPPMYSFTTSPAIELPRMEWIFSRRRITSLGRLGTCALEIKINTLICLKN